MSKVYLVTEGEYSDYCVRAVFSNDKIARDYAALISGKWDEARVEEMEMDAPREETKIS